MQLWKLLLGLGLIATAVSCRGGSVESPTPRPDHPLLAKLQAPPLNVPVHATPVPDDDTRSSPPSPPTEAGILVDTQGRSEGTVQLGGQLSVSGNRIQVTGQDNQQSTLVYRLPAGLSPLPDYRGVGTVTIVDQSDPAGPDRRIVVRSSAGLMLAEFMVKSPDPVTVDIEEGLRLVQRSVQRSIAEGELRAARVDVIGRKTRATDLTIGKPSRVQTENGTFDVFIQASYFVRAASREQHAGGFILEAWVVRAR